MIGAIGPSLTRFAIEGANSLPASPFWPDFWPNAAFEDYGGGDIEAWGGPWWSFRTRLYWEDFQDSVDAYGVPSAVWVMVVMRKQKSDPTTQQIRMFERIIKRTRKRCPGSTIVVSGMFEFQPWCLCRSLGPASYRASWDLVRRFDLELDYETGPDLHPLDSSNNNGPGDPCHQGPELRLIHGKELKEYFA